MGDITELYTTQQVARMLSVSDQHVRRMVASGQATPKTRVGIIYMFTLEEVEKLRNRRKRGDRRQSASK